MGRRAVGLASAAVAAGVVVLHALGGAAGGEATAGHGPDLVQAAGPAPAKAATAWQPPDPAAPAARPCEAMAAPQAPAPADASTLALARQAAAHRLAGGDAAERTLALLLQAPPVDDAAQRATWATQVLASALASSDAPTLRAAAASACPHASDARGCRLQLIQRRIELDPGNARPWVEWLDEDPAAADEAWTGLAVASHWRDDPQRLASTLGRALDPRLPAALRRALQADAAAFDADAPAAALSALQTPCGHWGATHPRGQACAHGVALMLGQADSPQTALEGAALARGMGWAEAPIESAEAQARRPLDTGPPQAPPACGPRAGLTPG